MLFSLSRGKAFPSRVRWKGCRKLKVSVYSSSLNKFILAQLSALFAKTVLSLEPRSLYSTKCRSVALTSVFTQSIWALEESSMVSPRMEDRLFKELEKKWLSIRLCSVSNVLDLFWQIGWPWSSRWAPFMPLTDLMEPPLFLQIMISWRDSNFTWLNLQVHASNTMDAPQEEEDN